MASVRNPITVFSGSEADGTVKTLTFSADGDPSTQRLLVGEVTSGSATFTLQVKVSQTNGTTTVSASHPEATLTGSSFAYNLNGPLHQVVLTKSGTGTAAILVMGDASIA